MTYAYPNSSFNLLKHNEWGRISLDDTAVSSESQVLGKNYVDSVKHYLMPVSRKWKNPQLRFQLLKAEWESEVGYLSSMTEIAMHPAYQQIIGMGPITLPFILSTMEIEPGHWFWALKCITGEDPVPPESIGRLKRMTECWLQWGREQGYIR